MEVFHPQDLNTASRNEQILFRPQYALRFQNFEFKPIGYNRFNTERSIIRRTIQEIFQPPALPFQKLSEEATLLA